MSPEDIQDKQHLPLKTLLETQTIPEDLLHMLAVDSAERVLQRYNSFGYRWLPNLKGAIRCKRQWLERETDDIALMQMNTRLSTQQMNLLRGPQRIGLNSPTRYVGGSVWFSTFRAGKKAALDTTAEAARAAAWIATDQKFNINESTAFLLGPPPGGPGGPGDPQFRTVWDEAFYQEQQWQKEHLFALLNLMHEERAALLHQLQLHHSRLEQVSHGYIGTLEDSLFTG